MTQVVEVFIVEKKIEKPSDLNGLKIRVQESNTAFEMIRSLGGSPTPISWGELYTSLQQGVVDAAENNTPSFYLSKHYEVCKYYIVDEHNMIPDVILSSTNLWNNLTINERKWLQEAVNLSVPFQRELWIKSEEESMRAIINSGVEIIYPDKDLFKKASLTMYDKLKKDTEINDLIARIKDEKIKN